MGNPEPQVDATQNVAKSQEQIDWEKRFKDTQGAYTKSQQKLKAAEAKLQALEQLTKPSINIDPQTEKELEDLKYANPDEWRNKMNQLEAEARQKHQELLSNASREAQAAAEMEHRKQVLADFQASHQDIVLTDDVLQFDVPPRITRRLENGEISFEAYLNEVATYLKTPKTIGDGNQVLNQPNLGQVGGGDEPSKQSTYKDIVENYNNTVF